MIHFHQVRFRDFKTYYLVYVLEHLRREFPHAVSYQRFVELMSAVFGPLCAYLPDLLWSMYRDFVCGLNTTCCVP